MDPIQIFATGGASGLAGLVIFLCFKFLQSRHHLVSQCTKDGITVTADANSPKIILPKVEDAKNADNTVDRSSDAGERCPSQPVHVREPPSSDGRTTTSG